MATIIAVTSGKGGVGKTTCCGNLAVALASLGKRVLAIDCDFGLRNLDLVLGLSDQAVYTLEDCILGGMEPSQAMVQKGENLYFLPPPYRYQKDLLTREKLRDFLEELRPEFDFILLDSAAGILENTQKAVSNCDMALVVITPDACSARDGDRAVTMLEEMGVEDIRLLINRVRANCVEEGIGLNVDDAMDLLGIPLAGIVAEDMEVLRSGGQVSPDSAAGQCFSNIARRLTGEQVPVYRFPRHGWWYRLWHGV
ncbi:MAG: septum site-determining protein MinD [Eubacteriales bacterium]|jgi:septum site-determining protein MinD